MKKLLLIMGIMCACVSLCACRPASNDGKKPSGDTPTTDPVGDKPIVPVTPPHDDAIKPGDIAVTFDTAGGSFGEGKTSVTLKAGEDGKVALEQQPRRDGYAFDGWYNGTVKYDPDAKFTASQTFTAKYSYGGDDAAYTALFDENSTVEIEINMSDAEWKKLDADTGAYQKSPIYRYADNVIISVANGSDVKNYYYEGVGVRMKGNTSRHKFYGNDGFYNAIHMKLSFKETFDDVGDGYGSDELYDWSDDTAGRSFRKNRTFGGMTKIDLKYNSTLDETYVRELYAMRLFRDNGVYAPNITLGGVYALEKNSRLKNLGVYRIHEPVDEQFVARHIEKTVGDLYKCTWGNQGWGNGSDLTDTDLYSRVGVNDELNNKLYAYEKKTNKKKDKTTGERDFSSIYDFIANINNWDEDCRQYIDDDYFAMFEAVNYLLGNPDCIRNHANNYYLYFRKSDGKAIFIPYDYDRCLGNRQWDCFNGMTEAQPFTRQTTINNDTQRNPLYIRLIDKGAPYNDGATLMKYRANLQTVANSTTLKASSFNAFKDKYKNKYGKFPGVAIGGELGNNLAWDNKVTFDNGRQNIGYGDYVDAKLTVMRNNLDNYRA